MISVIVPVYNEPVGLKETIDSLLRQVGGISHEIIIADNGSTDETITVASQFVENYPDKVKLVIEDQKQGSYAARNKGIGVASGEYICFIDADMTAPDTYLQKIFSAFQSHGISYIGCRVHVYSDKKTLAAKYNQLNGFKVQSDLIHNNFVPTCCLSIRKEILDQVGLFDERLESGGDYEFGRRVHEAGFKQLYLDDVVLKHPARWKYSSLVKKSKRVARGICQLAHYNPEQYRSRYENYFGLRRHYPKNPLRIKRKATAENISLSWSETILLAFYHIPITLQSTGEAKRFMKQLEMQPNSEDSDLEQECNPLVSVNITTYNRANLLERCLDSVLSQKYENLEVIIVDDCSPDHTAEVAQRYCELDNRVKYIRHQENRGNAYARNTALENCRGTYVAFMDDDDEWIDRDKISKQIAIFQQSSDKKLGIVCSGVKVIDQYNQEVIKAVSQPSNLTTVLLKGNGIIHNSTVMTKRAIMKQVGGFDTQMPRGIDSEFFRTVVVKYGYHVHFMPDITAAYHEHGEARMTTDKKNAIKKTWKANVHVIGKHFGSFLRHPDALAYRVGSRVKKILSY
uniref:Glycosyltransferase n=1 Tax=Roseihalotalea indica TaxID=2867963 RepID=A0AA49GJ91_9BACT|nr:glycosyltransferase [Tunicatimonas sp. TK19036]